MASKVNVKFVVILAAGLMLLAGGVGGAYMYVRFKSGDRYIRKGDAAFAKGDYTAADVFYSRAVAKDQTNLDWLVKWRDARMRMIPETQSKYQEAYMMYAHGILKSLATSKKTDIAAHVDYLEQVYTERSAGMYSVGAWQVLVDEAENAMRFFEPDRPAKLRRYRGLALSALLSIDPNLKDEQRTLCREDLEAALADNPADTMVVNELSFWHRSAGMKAKAAGDSAKARESLARSVEIVETALKANPRDPFLNVSKLLLEVMEASQIGEEGTASADDMRRRAAAFAALKPRLQEVARVLKESDPKALTSLTLRRFMMAVPQVDAKDGPVLAREITDRALEGRKDDADLLLCRAEAMYMAGDLEGTIKQYEHVAALPDLPVSFEGFRLFETRRASWFAMTNAALAMVSRATDDEGRKAAMARAKALREKLATQVAPGAPELLFVDGKTAFLSGDLRQAQALLVEFTKAGAGMGGQLVEAYLVLADAAARLGQPGEARMYLARAGELRPGSLELKLVLAGLETNLQNRVRAAELYRQVLAADPDNATAKRELAILMGAEGGAIDDPVLKVLVEADRLLRGDAKSIGDDDAAIRVIERALEANKHDPRLIVAIARIRVTKEDYDGANAIVALGVEKNPDNADLKAFQAQVAAANSLEGSLRVVAASNASDLEKRLSEQRIYERYGQREKADAAFDEAARLAPDDARVIEGRFIRAIRKDDLAEAGRLAQIATERNLDAAQGDTFRARLQLASRNYRDAALTLERAVGRGNAPIIVHRMLAAVLVQLGRGADAVAVLRRANEIDPTDVTTIRQYIETLVQLGRTAEALGVARLSEVHARRDPIFINQWLTLEALEGNKAFARERREQYLARNPNDGDNAAALADLQIDAKEWGQARALLDRLRAQKDSLRLAATDARWHADRGDVARARQVFVDFISARASAGESTGDAYVALGQFLLQRGEQATGIAALKQAERSQDTATMPVSILLGDVQLTSGAFEGAEQAYRKVLEAKVPDPQNRIRKRMIECLIQLQRADDAEKEFTALGAAADDDSELLVQHAQVVRLRGDSRRARELLDRAVAKFPEDPVPYLRRARLLMTNPEFARDALDDLATAIRLRPGMWQALRTRAMLHAAMGRASDALKDWRAAVAQNPGNDGLRVECIEELLRQGEEAEAMDLAEAGVKQRPNDLRLQTAMAQVFAGAGRWARASKFYKAIWEQVGDEPSATRYVNALLSSTPPAINEARAVLATPKLQIDKSPGLLMSAASILKKQNNEREARVVCLQAFDLIGKDTTALMQWYDRLRQVFPDVAGALAVLNAAKPSPSVAEWVDYLRAATIVDDPGRRLEGLDLMRAMLAKTQERSIKIALWRAISSTLAKDEKWADAYEATKEGLALEPQDAMLSNNAAYFLAEKLGRPAEAIPFAERAVNLAPGTWEVVDTLATAYWMSGSKPRAIEMLESTVRLARTDADRATTLLKLGRWKLDHGEKAGAAAALDLIREMISDDPRLAEPIKKDMDKLAKDIEAAR
ncbi:MAG: tetratricopeptide repeat protein [Phycisphaerae bacterium]|nr:tetratricopeptide repeat protein [Phycisphaerae bacterium]